MRKTCTSALLAIPMALLAALAHADDSPIGRWKTIDDETGKAKSIIDIHKDANGQLAGTVAEILQSDKGPDPICDKCDGERKGKPIKGMTILWDLKPESADVWSGGTVLDPSKGKTYRAKITLTDGGQKLQMRGYIGIEAMGRTQTWVRE